MFPLEYGLRPRDGLVDVVVATQDEIHNVEGDLALRSDLALRWHCTQAGKPTRHRTVSQQVSEQVSQQVLQVLQVLPVLQVLQVPKPIPHKKKGPPQKKVREVWGGGGVGEMGGGGKTHLTMFVDYVEKAPNKGARETGHCVTTCVVASAPPTPSIRGVSQEGGARAGRRGAHVGAG